MMLARVYLAQARRLPHLCTKAQRHAWVRAKLRYPAARVAVGAPMPPARWQGFVR